MLATFFWGISTFCARTLELNSLEPGASISQNIPSTANDMILAARRAMVQIKVGTVQVGSVICIDPSGLFIGPSSALQGHDFDGIDQDGHPLLLAEIAADPVSGLTLLRASGKVGPYKCVPWISSTQTHQVLYAVLPGADARAVITKTNLVGALPNSKHNTLLNEVQFDASIQNMNGAFLLNEQGQLAGIVSAIMPANPQAVQKMVPAGGGGFGPSGLIIVYTVPSLILNRAIQGLTSPSHQVRYPLLGLICGDARNGTGLNVGAVVNQVVQNSPAQAAGFRVGDVIKKINDTTVTTQVDYARTILSLSPDDLVTVFLNRGGREVEIKVKLGTAHVHMIQRIQLP